MVNRSTAGDASATALATGTVARHAHQTEDQILRLRPTGDRLQWQLRPLLRRCGHRLARGEGVRRHGVGGIGTDIVTARLEIDFKAAARLGDELETTVSVGRFGNTSMTLNLVTRRLSDEMVVAEGKAVYVFVDPEHYRPVSVPEIVKEGLA
ncbi:MAG: acyl-CoA thioesterase [Acidimicrobiia bacterium]